MSVHWLNDLELERRIQAAVNAHYTKDHTPLASANASEERMREIAREEVRAAERAWMDDAKKVNAQMCSDARDSALEEAAHLCADGAPGDYGNSAKLTCINLAARICSLKSQAAAQASRDIDQSVYVREVEQRQLGAERERDTLRARLAEAEKVLDDLERWLDDGAHDQRGNPWIADVVAAQEVLRRTGRLGGKAAR